MFPPLDPASLLWGSALACGIYALSLFLHVILPGREVVGYACRDVSTRDVRDLTLRNNTNNNRFAADEAIRENDESGRGMIFWILALAAGPAWMMSGENYEMLLSARSGSGSNDPLGLIYWAAASYYPYLGGCCVASFVLGVALTTALYRRGVAWCRSRDFVKRETLQCFTASDLPAIQSEAMRVASRRRRLVSLGAYYAGVGEFNPRWRVRLGRAVIKVDIKMWLYLAGTLMLEFHVLVLAGAHAVIYNDGNLSRAMGVSTLCWTWFCVDYISNEQIHLYTYDIFAERIGFKLVWGCLFMYPFFYPLGQHCIVTANVSETGDITWNAAILIGALFLTGWIMTRGANYQKFVFKHRKEQIDVMFGSIPQLSFRTRTARRRSGGSKEHLSTNGIMRKKPSGPSAGSRNGDQALQESQTPSRSLLISGFWGLSRHINYFGEIVQGFALGLPGYLVSGSPVAFAYFLFIATLLVNRERDDERLCRMKYDSEQWKEYTTLVPYRMVPLIY